MNEPNLVPTDRSPDLATYKLISDGQVLPERFQVQSIVVDRELNRIPTATILILDGDVAKASFDYSADKLFAPGVVFEIRLGYHGKESTVFRGLLVRQAIRSRNAQPSQLRLVCKDAAVKMTVGRKTAFFYEQTDSDIAGELAEHHGLRTDIESTDVAHREMVQARVSDWDFMVARMEANGKLVSPVNGTIRAFAPNLAADPVLVLKYGDTMLDFEAEIDALDQRDSVQATAWDLAEQSPVQATSGETAAIGGQMDPSALAAVAALDVEDWHHGGTLADEELQAWSDARLMRSRLAMVRGHVRCQGYALLPGQLIELTGVGNRFNGKVFVSAVRHELANHHWTTAIQFGLDSRWHRQRFAVEEPSPQWVPGVRGLQVGVTRQIDQDPDGEYRVLVALPVWDSEEDGLWARIATLDAGDNRGTFFRPEPGDEVVLGFLDGDPRQAVILGMLHSSAKAPPTEPSNDNHEKGFVSRSGLKIWFDDQAKAMRFSTPANNHVVMSDEDSSIYLKDQHGNSLTLNREGITLDSIGDLVLKAANNLQMSGMVVDLAADNELVAKGKSAVKFESGGFMEIKGAMVAIN